MSGNSTAGSSTIENTQPLVLNYVKGTLALAHNGNLVNAPELLQRTRLRWSDFSRPRSTLRSSPTTSRERRCKVGTAEGAVANAMKKIKVRTPL